MHRIQRQYEEHNKMTLKVKNRIDYISRNLSVIVTCLFMATCSGVMINSDIKRGNYEQDTEYFKVVDKDFKDVSNDFIPRYKHIIYIERYDKNKNIIPSTSLYNDKIVSENLYSTLKTDTLYNYTQTLNIVKGKTSNAP